MTDITKNTKGGTGALSDTTAKQNVNEILSSGNVSSFTIGGNVNSVVSADTGTNQTIESFLTEATNKFFANHDPTSTSLGKTMALSVTKESNPKLFSLIGNTWQNSISGFRLLKNNELSAF